MQLVERCRRFAELPSPPRRNATFIGSLRVQLRVVIALMMRGALMRYGHENLGFFWLMGEPLLMTSGVMAMWTLAGMDHGHGVSLIPFVLTGYSMLTLWRHVIGHMGHTINMSAGLMFHRQITMIDVMIGNVVLESLGGLAAFFIAYIPLYMIGSVPEIYDPLLLIAGWAFLTWLAFGFGMIIAGLSALSEAVARFIPALLYITLPATGAFYMLSWLPEKTQRILFWSPLVQPFEMFRGGLFGRHVQPQFSPTYMAVVCVVLCALGLALVRKAGKHVEVS